MSREESHIRKQSPIFVCGIDEAGRGALAGPVVASAVILPVNMSIPKLKDSKKLTPTIRECLFSVIQEQAMAWGIGWVWQNEIDQINIHRASLRAMARALELCLEAIVTDIFSQELVILVDGKFLPDFRTSRFIELIQRCDCQAVVKGDNKIQAISAASVLAKVTRDRWMNDYHAIEPAYGFNRHKGYPTPSHKKAIYLHGPSTIQRRSFQFTRTKYSQPDATADVTET